MPVKRASAAPSGTALDAAVAETLRAGLPEVAARTVASVITEVAEYADPLSGAFGENIAQAVELALATFLRLAEEADSVDSGGRIGPVVEAAYGLGRGEARSGRTMNALLSAYRVGARVAWEQWGAAALEAGVAPASLIRLAALVFAYIDQLSAASIAGHSDELATTGRVRDQYRERLARALLIGVPVDELERRAARADWRPPRTLTCILAPSAHTAAVRNHFDIGVLSVEGDVVDPASTADMTVHLVPNLGSSRAAIQGQLTGRAWVVGPERPWQLASSSYRLSLRALDLYGPVSEVIDTESHLPELVVTADVDALSDLRARVLEPLSGLKPATAERLAETLRSWLLHQGRRNDVAAHLVVHPQTVRYRMTQIRESFGTLLEDADFISGLIVALSAPISKRQDPVNVQEPSETVA